VKTYDPLSDDYDPYGESGSISSDKENSDIIPVSKTEKSSESVKLELKVSNSWESSGNKYQQLDGKIVNNSKSTVSGWTVKITADKNVKKDQSWNCGISIKSGVITVTPADYNKDISAGGEGTFGMILCNAGTIDASKSTLTYGSKTVSASSASNSSTSSSSGSSASSVGNSNPKIVQAKNVPAPTTDDWLYVKGNKIVDKSGKAVWLTGVNWFGYNTGTNTFDGLWHVTLYFA
jgi:hypothetical protein